MAGSDLRPSLYHCFGWEACGKFLRQRFIRESFLFCRGLALGYFGFLLRERSVLFHLLLYRAIAAPGFGNGAGLDEMAGNPPERFDGLSFS